MNDRHELFTFLFSRRQTLPDLPKVLSAIISSSSRVVMSTQRRDLKPRLREIYFSMRYRLGWNWMFPRLITRCDLTSLTASVTVIPN